MNLLNYSRIIKDAESGSNQEEMDLAGHFRFDCSQGLRYVIITMCGSLEAGHGEGTGKAEHEFSECVCL